MSKVTLADLRADYLAAKRKRLGAMDKVVADMTNVKPKWWFLLRCLRLFESMKSVRQDAIGKSFWTDDDLQRKATIYLIAKKEGMKAAMLWKLSN